MRKWQVGFLLAAGLLITVMVTTTPPAQSPLTNDSRIADIRQQWSDDLLLPTTLYGKAELNQARIGEQEGIRYLAMDIELLPDEGNRAGVLEIIEHPVDEDQITHLYDQPLETIREEVKKPLVAEPGRYLRGQITQLEEVRAGDGTAYWYAISSMSSGEFEAQAVEFVQDGYQVRLTLNLTEKQFPKKRLVGIAKSFARME